MKKVAKSIVVAILGNQVKRLRSKNRLIVVAVVGSIGKTSTKFAIARTLSSVKSVRWQEGNYNDIVSVPLVFFGHSMPSLFNPFAWVKIFLSNELQIRGSYAYEVVVLELGTDGPGQIAQFKKYIHSDISVVTAITPEHMEFFTDLDAVAREEFSVANYSKTVIVNSDLVDHKYFQDQQSQVTYGSRKADFEMTNLKFGKQGATYELKKKNKTWLELEANAVSKAELYSATAAAIVGDTLGLTASQIKAGIKGLEPVSGRMQRLQGIKGSLILDETYNASPEAVIAALDSLYAIKASQKIALLGNMNELGAFSQDAHTSVGTYCDPKQLDLVVTLGPDANSYLAAAAKKAGCTVKSFDNPYDAGKYILEVLKPDAVVLAKGSQNNVYAEEALKSLLANPADAAKLVRQSSYWLKKKEKNFSL